MNFMTLDQAFSLAQEHHSAGRLPEAEEIYRRILAAAPLHSGALHYLGLIAFQRGRVNDAVELMKRSIELEPGNSAYYDNLGTVYRETERVDEAIECSRRALALEPDHPMSLNNLGNALRDKGRQEEALACFDRARALDPSYPEAEHNRAVALKDLGRIEESLGAHRRALELRPHWPDSHSNYLLTLHYPPSITPEAIFAEHRRWDALFGAPPGGSIPPHTNDRDPGRRLRIGFVSPDFRGHSVAIFFENLLAHYDRAEAELYCYAQVARADAVTVRLQKSAQHWRSIVGATDAEVADLIRGDGIDVLVDLAGHTADHRLLVFARKPAPVQVTYLGYCDTTGLRTMDYRLTDALADPPGNERWHTERLLRLPRAAWCFQPHAESPPVSALPAQEKGYVTFGCFNTLPKLTDEMIALWVRILEAVPGARLLLKYCGLHEVAARASTLRRLVALGLAPDRLEQLAPCATVPEHLATYGSVDVALDTFPYHGTTTTCEALWMGVPVVSRVGETHVSRVGVSLLTSAGLTECLARTPEEYVRIAVDLARDLPRLAALRSSLRGKMQASPLLDAPGFAREVAAAFRSAWRAWCASAPR